MYKITVMTIVLVSVFSSQLFAQQGTESENFFMENREVILSRLYTFLETDAYNTDPEFQVWLKQRGWWKEIPSVAGAGNSRGVELPLLGFDQSALLNSLARVVTKRFQETVNSYFFTTFKDILNSDPLLASLFPLTRRAMNSGAQTNFQSLFLIFERDLQTMAPHLLQYAKKNLQFSPEVKKLLTLYDLSYTIFEKLVKGESPQSIIGDVDIASLEGIVDEPIINALQWIKAITRIDFTVFQDAFFYTKAGQYVLFTIDKEYSHDILSALFGIDANVSIAEEANTVYTQALKIIEQQVDGFTTAIARIAGGFEKIKQQLAALDAKSPLDTYLALAGDFLSLIFDTTDLIFSTVDPEILPGNLQKEIAEARAEVAAYIEEGAETVETVLAAQAAAVEKLFSYYRDAIGIFDRIRDDIGLRRYDAAINEAAGLLLDIYTENQVYLEKYFAAEKEAIGSAYKEVTETSSKLMAEKTAELEKFYNEKKALFASQAVIKHLLKYGGFVATLAMNSGDPAAMDKAIESLFPVLSPYTKKQASFGVYLNTYVGIDLGAETTNLSNLFTTPDFRSLLDFEIKAPVGFEISFRGIAKILSPIGLFVYPVDLGNLVSYYLNGIGTENLAFGFEQAFAPGGMLFCGLGNSPAVIGIGYQYRPNLKLAEEARHRITVLVCIDVPLMEIYRVE